MKPQLHQLADDTIRRLFGVDPATWPLSELVYLVFMGAAAGAVFVFALHFAGLFIFFERRIAARMQARVGPNRVGPNGIVQWAVDGIKCLFKEDLIPRDADQPLFRMSPYFVVLGMVLAFAAMPFSSALIATDINIGILFVLGVTSLVVIGLLMGGWGSNSKWALLGGMRSAAQVVSYEIPASMAAMSAIAIAGSLSMQDLIKAQGGAYGIFNWTIFHSPFTVAAFFIFFVSSLAEGNRTPFDLPEAESELVSGYNTEYSGMRFLMFFLGEFANVWLMCAVPVTLFLGGWQIPWGTEADGITPTGWVIAGSSGILGLMMIGAAVPALAIAYGILKYRGRAHARIDIAHVPGKHPQLVKLALRGSVDGAMGAHAFAGILLIGLGATLFGEMVGAISIFPEEPVWTATREFLAINGLQLGIFMAKSLVLVFVVIQLRWTLPRIRVDQMMTLCWKYLVPLSIACLVGTLCLELVYKAAPWLGLVVRLSMALLLIALTLFYVSKVKRSYAVDRDNFENYTGKPLFYPPWKLP